MGMVDSILYEFKGQLSISDIYNMTYKELYYLKQHREELLSKPEVQKAEAASALLGQ